MSTTARVRAVCGEKMKRHVTLLAAVLAAGVNLPTIAAESAVPQEAVIVTATRLDEASRRLPAPITILTADDIRNSPAKTLPELLALEAGVTTRSLYGNHAAGATVDLRGFGATATQNTLILLDGRRLNDVDLSAVDFGAIPLGNIARIEIIRGGGAVLYGDGAVGGTVNIITREPGRGGTTGQVNATAGSYDTRGYEATVSHGAGPWAVNLAANHVSADGYRKNNNLERSNFQADLRHRQSHGEWFLKFGADDENLRLPGVRRVNPGLGIDELSTDRRGTNTPNDYADQNGAYLTAGLSRFLMSNTEWVLDAGVRTKNQKAFYDDYQFGGLYTSYLDSDLTTFSFTPRLKTRHALFGAPGTSQVGLDYYRSQYRSDRALTASTVDTPIHRLDIRQTSTAVYGQNTSTLWSRTALTLGARLQHVTQRARDEFNVAAPGGAGGSGAPDYRSSERQYMYEAGLRQTLSAEWSAYAKATRSSRFATVDELFESDPATFVKVFSPLKPQTARGLDVGTDYARGDFKLGASLYYMTLENEIHFNPTTFTNDNLDPTKRRGLNLNAGTKLAPSLRLKGDYAHTRAFFRQGSFAGNDVPLVSRNTVAVLLAWDVAPGNILSAGARHVGAKRFDNDQSNSFYRQIPGYDVVDLKLLQSLSGWKLTWAVNNVFDEKFYDYGIRSTSSATTYNAYPLPERNFSVALGKDF
jgi:iron complex outermembrane receptor protein